MVFDGAGCLKWFSGDGSSVWCQWDRGGTRGGGGGGHDGNYTALGEPGLGGAEDGEMEREEEQMKRSNGYK